MKCIYRLISFQLSKLDFVKGMGVKINDENKVEGRLFGVK